MLKTPLVKCCLTNVRLANGTENRLSVRLWFHIYHLHYYCLLLVIVHCLIHMTLLVSASSASSSSSSSSSYSPSSPTSPSSHHKYHLHSYSSMASFTLPSFAKIGKFPFIVHHHQLIFVLMLSVGCLLLHTNTPKPITAKQISSVSAHLFSVCVWMGGREKGTNSQSH